MGNSESFFHGRFKKLKKESKTSKNIPSDYDLLYKSYKIIEVADDGTQTDSTTCYLNKIETVIYSLLKKCVNDSLLNLISHSNTNLNEDLRSVRNEDISVCTSNILNHIGKDIAQNCVHLSSQINANKIIKKLEHKGCQTLNDCDKKKLKILYSKSDIIHSYSEFSNSIGVQSPILSSKVSDRTKSFNCCSNITSNSKFSNQNRSIQTITDNHETNSISCMNDKEKILTYINENNISIDRPKYRYVLQRYLNGNKRFSSGSFEEYIKNINNLKVEQKSTQFDLKKISSVPNIKQNKDRNTENTIKKHEKLNKNREDNKHSKKHKKYKNSIHTKKILKFKAKELNSKLLTINKKPSPKVIVNKMDDSKQNPTNNDNIIQTFLSQTIPDKGTELSIHSSDELNEHYWQNSSHACESSGKFGIHFSNHTIFKKDSNLFKTSNSDCLNIDSKWRTLSGYVLKKKVKHNLLQSCYSLDNLKIKSHVLLIRTWSGMWFKSRKPRFDTWSTEEFTAFI